jgi:hypothetical protein
VKHKAIPKFTSEGEEATWWDAHPEALEERLFAAQKQGLLRRLGQTSVPRASDTVMICIPRGELVRARRLAAKRGLRYQTYLKMLLNEALNAEEKGRLHHPERRSPS